MAAEKKPILTVKNIRNVNVDNILQSVIRGRNTTRSVLAKENHISLMTVKHVVDSLITKEILVERDSCSSDLGRKPKVLELAEPYGNIVCMNLTSRDEISFLIYNIYEELLTQQTLSLEGFSSYMDGLRAAVQELKKSLEQIDSRTVGVSVFVPSAYDENVDLVNYDLIPGFKELHIRSFFEKEFKIKNIRILHDVFAAARSEYDSLNPKPTSQFYFYCGYGVGGCFIHKDEAVVGSEKMAGEVGKMLVSVEGCADTNMTLEDRVSITAIKSQMKECGMSMKFMELLADYREQKEEAQRLLLPALCTVSKTLYNLLWVYNPSRIVIDSCSKEYSELIAEHFRAFMDRMKNDAIPIHVEIQCAKYDEYHMMKGCFSMARNFWIEEIADSI